MMTVSAMNMSSTSQARTELERYQRKLATDLVAKAAERVITTDRAAVATTERAVRQNERGGGTAVDISV